MLSKNIFLLLFLFLFFENLFSNDCNINIEVMVDYKCETKDFICEDGFPPVKKRNDLYTCSRNIHPIFFNKINVDGIWRQNEFKCKNGIEPSITMNKEYIKNSFPNGENYNIKGFFPEKKDFWKYTCKRINCFSKGLINVDRSCKLKDFLCKTDMFPPDFIKSKGFYTCERKLKCNYDEYFLYNECVKKTTVKRNYCSSMSFSRLLNEQNIYLTCDDEKFLKELKSNKKNMRNKNEFK